MHRTDPPSPPLAELFAGLDRAVGAAEPARVTADVKAALIRAVTGGALSLDPALLRPTHTMAYGRRLLHRHPQGSYSVVVMTWAPGQGTPVHDHAGLWCVECVYAGRIRVRSFDLEARVAEERVRLVDHGTIEAGVGDAGALIPPHDFHVIQNPFDETAVTVHVYGGDMDWCYRYEPLGDGVYARERRELSFTPATC